jgi:DNA repair exonuclease SbcCD ATPase subunit
MNTPRLTELRASAFRGFASPRIIPLDADAVLIRGDNGSGKTSIVDAFLWALTGRLPQLEERMRGQRKQFDPLLNLYSQGETPTVAIDIAAGDTRWTLERTGSLRDNQLIISRNGIDTDTRPQDISDLFGIHGTDEFSEAVRTWGVLRQDALRTAIEEGGGTLHQRMASVLGLERVATFAAEARRLCTDASKRATQLDREVQQLTHQLEQAKAQAAHAQQHTDTASAAHDIQQRLQAHADALPAPLTADVASAGSLSAISTLGLDINALTGPMTQLLERRRALNVVAATSDQTAEQAIAAANAAVLRASESLPATAKLAQHALPLLGEYCPVCTQAIDHQHVAQHLEAVIEQAAVGQARVAEARAQLDDAQQLLAISATARNQRSRALKGIQDAEQQLADATRSLKVLTAPADWWHDIELDDAIDTLHYVRGELRTLFDQARTSLGGDAARFESTIEAITIELDAKRVEQTEHAARVTQATELDEAAQQASKRIMARALKRLEPTFAEVFDRLAPHPTFTRLRAKQDIYFKKNQVVPEVVDPITDTPANPALVYSEGQLNVVALSYFLGLALNARDGALPFLVLDDPLQAMDVVSVLGFADMARRLRESRQLIVTTHDRRFADVLARKLRPRDAQHQTLIIELEAWTRDGPRITSSYAEPATVEMVLHSAA